MRATTYFRAYVQCRDELSKIQNIVPSRAFKYLEAYRQEPPVGGHVVLLTGLAMEVNYYAELWKRRDRLAQKLARKLERKLGAMLDKGEEA